MTKKNVINNNITYNSSFRTVEITEFTAILFNANRCISTNIIKDDEIIRKCNCSRKSHSITIHTASKIHIYKSNVFYF